MGEHPLLSLAMILSNTTSMPSVQQQAKRFRSGMSARNWRTPGQTLWRLVVDAACSICNAHCRIGQEPASRCDAHREQRDLFPTDPRFAAFGVQAR